MHRPVIGFKGQAEAFGFYNSVAQVLFLSSRA
jgi:hypothetical protein